MMDARRFALMKPTAFFVNLARGPVVDEAALIDALRSGRIAGAGIDVFEQEPVDPANPLLAMPQVIVTPHALCWTDECFDAIAREGLGCIVDFSLGHTPKSVVRAG
jgi:phosphoglycerate dehydrogenase-like enzyme